jgi:hypothetical protein
MESSKNQGIQSMLKDKFSNQLEMLKELMEMSENTKRKMIRQLKDEVNKL